VHPGHTLVVPKRHVSDLISCPPDLAGRLLTVSAELAPAIVGATGAAGFNVWTANGRVAGQEVFHLHLHLLPRHENDAFGLRFPRGYPREAPRQELDALAAKVRAALSRGR
jgi:diadenosine tetraphosphate (Ap4A) HIT family hydrolase